MSKYKDRYCQDVVAHCSNGFTLKSFCVIAGISESTLKRWRKEKPEFDDACSVASNTVSLFYQQLARNAAQNGNFNAIKEMLKATDKDFGNNVNVESTHTTVYQIDLGEVAQIVNSNSEDDDIITVEDFKEVQSINERDSSGRELRGPEDAENVEELLVGKDDDGYDEEEKEENVGTNVDI